MSKSIINRYSDSDLEFFKQLIEGKLEKAYKELKYLENQLAEVNENNNNQTGSDWADDSTTHAEIKMLNNMGGRQRMFIRSLENALIRIANKTYGICSITGTLISKERLLLVPHATKSVTGKQTEVKTPFIRSVATNRIGKKIKVKSSTKKKTKSADKVTKEPIADLDANLMAEDNLLEELGVEELKEEELKKAISDDDMAEASGAEE